LTAQGHPRAIFKRAIENGDSFFSHAQDPELDTGCDNASVTAPQIRDGSGRWSRGVSSNPGGRPQGLARATRELVGEDGMPLAELWWSIAQDPMRRDSDRLAASRLGEADPYWGCRRAERPGGGGSVLDRSSPRFSECQTLGIGRRPD
jgi:hypothetical protein